MTRARDLASLGDNTSQLEQQGLVKIIPSSVAVGSGTGSASASGTVTFTTVSSVSLNSIFSSTYRNYKIVIDLTAASASTSQNFKLRSGATDSSSSYYYGFMGIKDLTGANNMTATNVTGGIQWSTSFGGFGDFLASDLIIYKPFIATRTILTGLGHGLTTVGGDRFSIAGAGFHDQATSYDGITIIPGSGTISGTVSVYGFN
jgi:hypothetical protein